MADKKLITPNKQNLLDIFKMQDPYDNMDKVNYQGGSIAGWNSDNPNFGYAANKNLILEIGSWVGGSAKSLAGQTKDGVVVCVDTFLGSHEHFIDCTVPKK